MIGVHEGLRGVVEMVAGTQTVESTISTEPLPRKRRVGQRARRDSSSVWVNLTLAGLKSS